MANWFTQFKGPHGGSGMASYRAALDAGYSPQDIAAAAPHSGLSVGWRLRDTIGTINASSQAARQAQAQSSGYESQLNSYKQQLSDYNSRFSDLTNKYEGAMAKQAELSSSVAEWEGKWNQSQADYEQARSEADAYREEAVDNQLSRIRAGTTVAGQQQGPSSGVLSGAGSKLRESEKDDGVNVQTNVQAEDSVLSKKGPVVEVLRKAGSTPSRAPGALTSGTGSRGNYYSSRFG